MKLTISSTKRLNDGSQIPYVGLGMWQIPTGKTGIELVKHALKEGYRHIDTAKAYGNEREVGEAVRTSGIPREEVFVTTKLWNRDHGYDKAIEACEQSLERLGLGYIDLYLIHWPVLGARKETWDALVQLKKEGKCRSIGVSNYTIEILREQMKGSTVLPSVNQVEFNPFLYQKELLDFCNGKGIAVEAYAPLTTGNKLDNPVLQDLSKTYSKSPAQILLRWGLQHDLVVLPRSSKPERISENIDIFDFEISSKDMAKLDAMNENFRAHGNPNDPNLVRSLANW